ncbi:kinase family protein [Striga asiatica]|uniref:Kinase family protein n=1 Tax=Striga asiatica TaxID=4170 RepID=A0A5A7R8E4_STRAF|nr:kinase family protein [Striga asiatica]
MGYFSCNADSAIATCGTYELLTKKTRKAAYQRPVKIIEFDFSELHAATDGFSPDNLLGKGSHGSVYKARLRPKNRVAAVKRTKPNDASVAAAENEVGILSAIQHHPRLVNLIGFGYEPEPDRRKLLVVEYMPGGSLYDLLHGSGRKPLGWVDRARFAVQVARAVCFLHGSDPPIIHRDIKSLNVLIDGGSNCRVSDFGLALRVGPNRARPAGTLGYLDPGYVYSGDVSTKSDVFSFGVLLLELITGRSPIDVGHSPPSVVEWAVPAVRTGEFGSICDPRVGPPEEGGAAALRRMAVLAARCVRPEAGRRPEMEEVVECLSGVYEGMRRRAGSCGGMRRRVGSRAGRYEQMDDSGELVKGRSKRKGKVSSAASAGEASGSRSTGGGGEIKSPPTDSVIRDEIKWKVGSSVRTATVRLRKSRSMVIFQSSNKWSVNDSGAAVVRSRTCARKLEVCKLLVD